MTQLRSNCRYCSNFFNIKLEYIFLPNFCEVISNHEGNILTSTICLHIDFIVTSSSPLSKSKSNQKTSKFEWTLDTTGIERIISAEIWAAVFLVFFLFFFFFFKFQLYCMLGTVPSCNLVQYQWKLILQPEENGKTPNFGPNLGPPIFLHGFYLYWTMFQAIILCNFQEN